eukprot:2320895-Pyramimonas_sp.AAC.1
MLPLHQSVFHNDTASPRAPPRARSKHNPSQRPPSWRRGPPRRTNKEGLPGDRTRTAWHKDEPRRSAPVRASLEAPL